MAAESRGVRRQFSLRSALVAELQKLGYEVNVQGQEWSEGTRITAARPNELNYDVQLSAVAGGQIQSKVRAYDHAGRGAGVNRRDVEVEQSWCDDLAKVNKLLAAVIFRCQVAWIKSLSCADPDLGEPCHEFCLGWASRAELQHEVQDVEEIQRRLQGFGRERLDEIDGRSGLRQGCAKKRRQRFSAATSRAVRTARAASYRSPTQLPREPAAAVRWCDRPRVTKLYPKLSVAVTQNARQLPVQVREKERRTSTVGSIRSLE